MSASSKPAPVLPPHSSIGDRSIEGRERLPIPACLYWAAVTLFSQRPRRSSDSTTAYGYWDDAWRYRVLQSWAAGRRLPTTVSVASPSRRNRRLRRSFVRHCLALGHAKLQASYDGGVPVDPAIDTASVAAWCEAVLELPHCATLSYFWAVEDEAQARSRSDAFARIEGS